MKRLLFLALTAVLYSCQGGGTGSPIVPEPYIDRISTDYEGNKAVAGQPVTLYGLNFSPVPSENKVLYGVGLDAVALRVSESSEEHVVFTAPEVDRTSLKIRVSTNGVESNQVTLEFTTPEPEEPWDPTPTIDFGKMTGGATVKIRDGIEWTSFHGTWEGQIRNINIVRTTLNEHNKLGMYFNYYTSAPEGYPAVEEGTDYRDLDYKCIYLDAIAGTNGPMACCHFARVNGVVQNLAHTDNSPWIENCALTIDGDVVDIVKVASDVAAAKLTNDPGGDRNYPANTLTVGCAGPLLVWNGIVQPYEDGWKEADKDKWLTTTHPRTAIGLSKDGKTVVQVAVDGRWTQSSSTERAIGMSTELLGKLMRGLGCYKAMNFDGGGGTAMWVYGQGNARNIVNRVCENRWNWNGTTLRPTGNAVYIKSDLK